MTDHAAKAEARLEDALDAAEPITPVLYIGAAGVHALLALGDAIRHGLRDIIYELRD